MDAAARAGMRLGFLLAAAHHPLCSAFRLDVVRVGPIRMCAGCAVAAPAFVVGVLAATLVPPMASPRALLILGFAMGVPHLATYARRLSVGARRAAKAAGGLGLGLVVATMLTAAPDLVAVAVAALAVMAMAIAFVALQALRLRAIRRTCASCPWRARWGECPGFQS